MRQEGGRGIVPKPFSRLGNLYAPFAANPKLASLRFAQTVGFAGAPVRQEFHPAFRKGLGTMPRPPSCLTAPSCPSGWGLICNLRFRPPPIYITRSIIQ